MVHAMLDSWLRPARQVLRDEATALAWKAGRDMPLEQAVELALAAREARPTRANRSQGCPGQRVADLTLREQEVATLLAHGLTNRQIAGRLVVTERTVGAHIGHILDRLGFNSRHQVGAWAAEHGLLD